MKYKNIRSVDDPLLIHVNYHLFKLQPYSHQATYIVIVDFLLYHNSDRVWLAVPQLHIPRVEKLLKLVCVAPNNDRDDAHATRKPLN